MTMRRKQSRHANKKEGRKEGKEEMEKLPFDS